MGFKFELLPPKGKPSLTSLHSSQTMETRLKMWRKTLLAKQKTLKTVEEQHKRALEEDPTVFEYDAIYDDMKSKSARSTSKQLSDNKPKYITKLIEKAKVRQQEQDIIYEKKLAKERSLEDHLYGDKEKIVTSAYKMKLAEQAKWLEEERLRDLQEQAEEVTKKNDLSEFYSNLLNKNVAFGGQSTYDQGNLKKSPTYSHMTEPKSEVTAPDVTGTEVFQREERGEEPVPGDINESIQSIAELPERERSNVGSMLEKQGVSHQTLQADKKPSQDLIAAAKERYLARKRMRENL